MRGLRDRLICRLCLSTGCRLIDILEESRNNEFVVKQAVEDLLQLVVLKEALYPWLVCSICLVKLREFHFFKQRCVENQEVYDSRIRGNNWLVNQVRSTECDDIPVKSEERDTVEDPLHHDALKNIDIDHSNQPVTEDFSLDSKVKSEEMTVCKSEVPSGDENCWSDADTRVPSLQLESIDDGSVSLEIPVKSEEGEGVENSMYVDPGRHPKTEVPGDDMEAPLGGIASAGTCSQEYDLGYGALSMQASLTQGRKRAATECPKVSIQASDVTESVFIVPLHVSASVVREGGQEKRNTSDSGYRRKDEIISSVVLEEEESREAVALHDNTRPSMRVMKRRKKNDAKSIEFTDMARNVGRIGAWGTGCGARSQLPLSDDNLFGRCFRCDKCGSRFRSKYFIGKHMKVHNVLSVFRCSTCNLDFENESEYKEHKCVEGQFNSRTLCNADKRLPDSAGSGPSNDRIQDVNPIKKLLSCGMCSKSFNSPSALAIHIRTHTGERPYSCTVCARAFAHKGNLKKHVILHDVSKPYSCSYCSKSFLRKDNLRSHMSVHLDLKAFSCNHCSKSFSHRGHLHSHMSVHTGLNAFSCSHCSKSFSSEDNLRGHMLVHTDLKAFSCSHCSKSFSRKHNLRSHMSVHTGVKGFPCNHCSKSFSRSDHLHSHMLVHTGIKAFSCSHCSKSFSHKHNLHSHMSVHTGLKPFSCNHCCKSFSRKDNLHSHMSVHTGLKAFSCSNCSKSFSSKSILIKHMKVHTGLKAYSCNHCSKSFSRKDNLHSHMSVHTGLKAFSCSRCSKSFYSKSILKKHMKVHT